VQYKFIFWFKISRSTASLESLVTDAVTDVQVLQQRGSRRWCQTVWLIITYVPCLSISYYLQHSSCELSAYCTSAGSQCCVLSTYRTLQGSQIVMCWLNVHSNQRKKLQKCKMWGKSLRGR